MIFPKVTKLKAVIPTASMADIAFLLTIFFILTTASSVDKTYLKLPQAAEREEIMDKRAAYIVVDKYGVIKFSSGTEMARDIDIENLPNYINLALKTYPQKQFVIKADKNVRYAIIEQILDYLAENNVSKIYLLAEPKSTN
jgi:biopolymer transport protein ExbD